MGSIPATEAHITALAELMDQVADCVEDLASLPRYVSGWRELREGVIGKTVQFHPEHMVRVTVDLNEDTLIIESL